MNWEAVRISILLATCPGLIMALMLLSEAETDLLDKYLIFWFVIFWLATLIIQVYPYIKGTI